MLEGINYLHAKFQIKILENKKVIKLLELWQLWITKRKKGQKRKECCFTTPKIANTKVLLSKH